ncbi:GGDEF domain-containing protein [Aestuariibacter sp. AA17]|uniref:diguanylate cyclase n=1 Tax=Fluctibacter corallii TaxID=2984329 RepID=A0ABT3A9Q6_9ALTE|nr:GGDEF domain-containing protein [Aestuariibacter sp. AA17]MCV2885007.1 GGDEF domain-containing protein [Aestuariibacter sp. AA17]
MEQIRYSSSSFDSVFSIDHLQSELSQFDLNTFMQQLLTTIDLRELAELYFCHLAGKLNLAGMRIVFNEDSLTLGDTQKSRNVRYLDFKHDVADQRQVLAKAEYFFNHVPSLKESAMLKEFHGYMSKPIKNAFEHHQLKQLAMKDHLTSLGNRRSYQESLHRMLSDAKRHNQSFGMLVIDLDNFKQVNDIHGHLEGDNVIRAMADILTQTLRDSDYAFRFGGDEFCCLLPGSLPEHNDIVAQRIMDHVANHPLLKRYSVSCSIGSAIYQREDCETKLFERADRALYHAKNAGRSCFIAA